MLAAAVSATSTSTTVGGPPKLVNLYHLRTVGTPKPCTMCSKDTTACLANGDVTDFIYTCHSHLKDPGFARPAQSASPAGSPRPATPVSQADIDKVKQEYEERQARKKSAEKAADEKKDDKPKTWLQTGVAGLSTLASATQSLLVSPPEEAEKDKDKPPPGPPPTTFVLHRGIFVMRQDMAKKKWQQKEAKDRMKTMEFPKVPTTLPSVPRTAPS